MVKWLRSRPPIWIDGGPSSNLGWRTYSYILFFVFARIYYVCFLVLFLSGYANTGATNALGCDIVSLQWFII